MYIVNFLQAKNYQVLADIKIQENNVTVLV